MWLVNKLHGIEWVIHIWWSQSFTNSFMIFRRCHMSTHTKEDEHSHPENIQKTSGVTKTKPRIRPASVRTNIILTTSHLRWLPTFERKIWAHDEHAHRNRGIKALHHHVMAAMTGGRNKGSFPSGKLHSFSCKWFESRFYCSCPLSWLPSRDGAKPLYENKFYWRTIRALNFNGAKLSNFAWTYMKKQLKNYLELFFLSTFGIGLNFDSENRSFKKA